MNLFEFGLLILAAILLFVLTTLQRKSAPKLRVIPAFTRLYRAVGLGVEDGTRLLIGLGGPGLISRSAGAPLAGLGLLRHLTERTSLSDRPPVVAAGEAPIAILAQDTLEAGYRSAGVGEFYQPSAGRLTGLTPFSSAAGILPILRDENVSAAFLIGHFGPEAGIIADAAERENALVVGSSDDLAAQAVLYAAAPEALIGEELFAAGAYLGTNRWQLASLSVQDWLRWLIILALAAGAVLKLLGLF